MCDESPQPVEKPPGKLNFVPDFAGWLLAIPALLYATGFLVMFTAEERLGIVNSGGDFFKVKYMHVGVLCVMYIGLFAGLAYLFSEWTNKEGRAGPTDLTRRHLLILFPVIAGIIVQLTIAPLGSFWWPPAGLLLGFTVVAVVVSSYAQVKRGTQADYQIHWGWLVLIAGLGWAFLVAEVCAVEWYLWKSPLKASVSFVMFAVFACLIGRSLFRSAEGARGQQTAGRRVAWWLIGMSFAGFFYYVDTYVFALAIYPHISVRKGGGDYCDAPDAVLYFVGRDNGAVPEDVLDGDRRSKLLVILLENAGVIYAAEDEGSERCRWGKSSKDRPKRIYQFNRSTVSAVEFVPRREPSP